MADLNLSDSFHWSSNSLGTFVEEFYYWIWKYFIWGREKNKLYLDAQHRERTIELDENIPFGELELESHFPLSHEK